MKKISKEERTRLWWEFAQNIGDALEHEDISGEVHEGLCDMLDNFLPEPERAAERYRRRIPDAALTLMPDDLTPPPRLKRDEPWLTDIFNELGESVCRILKDDRTPEKVRKVLIDFMSEFDRLAQAADPERYRRDHAQMMFPLTLDILNDRGDDAEDDDEGGDAIAPQHDAVM
jgi:hypothetical protein